MDLENIRCGYLGSPNAGEHRLVWKPLELARLSYRQICVVPIIICAI